MRWMVKIQVEKLASVGEISVNFVGQCCLFPYDQNIQERNYIPGSISVVSGWKTLNYHGY
jgi:hypothetical protein